MARNPKPGASRPRCILCGKGYGSRHTETTVERIPICEPVPPYQGNGVLIRSKVEPTRYDTGHAYYPDRWVIVAGSLTGEATHNRVERETWDGESYRGGNAPWCSLRCADTFARAAYRDGFRYTTKGEG